MHRTVILLLALTACGKARDKEQERRDSQASLDASFPVRLDGVTATPRPDKKLDVSFTPIGRTGKPMRAESSYAFKILACNGGDTLRPTNYKGDVATLQIDLAHCDCGPSAKATPLELSVDSADEGKQIKITQTVDLTASCARSAEDTAAIASAQEEGEGAPRQVDGPDARASVRRRRGAATGRAATTR